MTRPQNCLLIIFLVISGFLVAVYSAMTPVGKSPDERHHFSYAYGIYEQGLSPFFDRKAIITDGKDANHLRHPPGYYFILAGVMAALDIDKDFRNVRLSSSEFSEPLKTAAIPSLRAVSLALYVIHLVGLYLLIRYLIERKLISAWAGIAATALLIFIPSRMHIAGTVNNDTLAMAVWPFLTLYGSKMLLEPSLSTFLKFALAGSVAALTKLTLAIVAMPLAGAIVLFQFLRFNPFGFQPQFSFWKQEIVGIRWKDAGLLAILIILVGFASTYYGNSLLKYGSVNPTYTQIYELPDQDNKFRVEGRQAKPWLAIAEDVVTSSWRTTTGAFGHEHLYADGNVTTELSLVAISVLAAISALVASLWLRSPTDPRNLTIPFIFLTIPILFWMIWIDWNVGNWEVNRRIGAQGRYTIGALEIGILGVFLAWGILATDRRRVIRLIGTMGSLLVFLILVPVFFKPMLYARMNDHLYFGARVSDLVSTKLANEGYNNIVLKASEPENFVKRGMIASNSTTRFKDYFLLAPNRARVVGAIPRIDTAKFRGVEVAVWGRAGSRLGELQLSVRDVANTTTPVAETIVLPTNVAVITRCFPIADPRMSIAIRRIDPDYSLLTRLFKNDNPPILLGAYAKPVAECK